MFFLLKSLKLLLVIATLLFACIFRTPFAAGLRGWTFGLILFISLGIIASELITWKGERTKTKLIIQFLVVAIASSGFFIATGTEARFNWIKHSVLNTEIIRLENLGRHFVVGYRNFDEVRELVSKRAIGGVFITARNVQNKTKDEIKQEIQTLQTIRQGQGLPPLWIATDQEGGMVSRLSPPLTLLPQLSSLIDSAAIDRSKDEVVNYAKTHGSELAEVGVNLNFAPVVDLNKGVISPNDKFSQIYQRAISTDANIITKVASWYCQTLEEYGVRCTLKHFPGLGRVETDTHLEDAELQTPVEELAREDWIPFRTLMSDTQSLTMLSHAKLVAVDPEHPTSFSKPVVTGILRDDWNYNGILITDDFSMGAVYRSKDGLRNATVKAINAGVDLVLISYDKDLYYEAMDALLKADLRNELEQQALEESRRRLETIS
ncbi:glycoside hydrolase family 3 protein [Leptolyngbya sp. FACHB-541]|uniref:glycoside hydrolase family 3 N-terminal domain-containing protein n=1 Tax=Leptolyngbya sp. FACHB-541 TaxID=2692810 RepID=UPI0016854337|nr:glycoside hydrolase family 3 N-terminal domain-containing protein [Leptolyngbya sp. FACHB-541]MBD1997992.1 glycoside hydrolase family 3 protein [Leptolyngbya sp. FACHB-541]